MGRVYFSVDEGKTDCSPAGCPLYGEMGCYVLDSLGLDCDRVDLSTLRRCEDGEVVAVK